MWCAGDDAERAFELDQFVDSGGTVFWPWSSHPISPATSQPLRRGRMRSMCSDSQPLLQRLWQLFDDTALEKIGLTFSLPRLSAFHAVYF